jgi:hypothetical protein
LILVFIGRQALQRGAVAASLRDDVASFDAVPPAVWSSNPLVGLQAPAHLISPFSSRAPRPATDAFDQAQVRTLCILFVSMCA